MSINLTNKLPYPAIAQCSYDGSATQVDLFNLVKLNETVDILQKRVQSIETDIKEVCSNTQYVANEVRTNRTTMDNQDTSITNEPVTREPAINRLMTTSNAEWKLSLTPKGLRVDTNIISLHALYDILLSRVSRFDLSGIQDTLSQSSSCTENASRADTATLLKKKPLWKSRLKTFPLYSSWGTEQRNKPIEEKNNEYIIHDDDTIQHMLNIFCECFLCLPCPDPQNSVKARYNNGTLDPLLANSVFAWTARHGAIHHDLFPGKDPNQVGQPFFMKAKSLIKERFMKTSVDTMHSLIIMYIYTIGIPSEQKTEIESEAYIYLGLAIRMCLDLKMHQESKHDSEIEREKNRRFFWVVYFLETLGSMHSDKPFALPPKNMITVQFPTVLDHEQKGEIKYRVEFMIQRFKITRIYRNIIYKTTEDKPLLSQVSAIDKELENWYLSLPAYLKYESGDLTKRNWNTTSFKEQSCIKLNFEYNFQLCQLYGLFFSKSSSNNSSTIEVLSRDICLKAAHNTVELLECWVQLNQRWCHFSLENLMVTTMIYNNILSQPDASEREIAKTNLEKMAHILLSAPVRHHKYVLSLVNRIKTIFRETLHTEIITDKDSLMPPVTLSNLLSNQYVHQPQQQQQQQQQKQQPQPQPQQQQHQQQQHQQQQPQPQPQPQQQQQQQQQKFHHEHENMHFSDFVYTPTLLDYNHHMLSSSSFGKKPDYDASYQYSPPHYYTPASVTPPIHSQSWTPIMLNHSAVATATTTTTTNNNNNEEHFPQKSPNSQEHYQNDGYHDPYY
ncbi:hypothetical protein HPULCUR_005973 [Helicostylum pulchrum]|uniref:Xylanolytic transcriptional activator regulatory domain-containing protein n=1 Tax=Helicostylum pulchrum TaxID=562976 RepID=A0ABP9Y1A5_9FUNG